MVLTLLRESGAMLGALMVQEDQVVQSVLHHTSKLVAV